MPLATGLAAAIVVLAIPGFGPAPASAGTSTPSARDAASDTVHDQEWWLAGLHVTQAWQASEGAGITVAVLGTGVDASDPNLPGAVITGPDYTGSGREPGSPYWGVEGTAVAGIIAGRGYDGNWNAGIVGIAPDAKILSIRVTLEFNDPLASDPAISQRLPDAIAEGITYAVDHGARVIDLPLDPGTLGLTSAGDPAAAGGSAAEQAAVRYALRSNVVLVAPSGDDGQGSQIVNYPAAYPGVIAVGAVDRSGQLAPFSSRRSYAALTAPGVGLVAVAPPDAYNQISSTSAASGMVAGMAALILAKFPHLTVAQVTQALIESTATTPNGTSLPALPPRSDTGAGYGTVDAMRALDMAALINAENQPPATPPARPRKAARPATAAPRPPDTGALARTALRGAVIGVSVLIVLLGGALLAGRSRRRRGHDPAAGRSRPRGQHEHRRPDRGPPAPPAPAAATAPAAPAAALPRRGGAAASQRAAFQPTAAFQPAAGTHASPPAEQWPSPGGWQGGGLGEIGFASALPPRPAVTPVPRAASGPRAAWGAGGQESAGPPWDPAPQPEGMIGPLPVPSAGSPPPQPGRGIRVPGDMAAPSDADEPSPPAAFDLSTPPADFDVSAPAFGLTPPTFGMPLPAFDAGPPADRDRPAPADRDFTAPPEPGFTAAPEPGFTAAPEPDLTGPPAPDLPTKASLDFAAAPVPADYAAPSEYAVPSEYSAPSEYAVPSEPTPRDYPAAAPPTDPSYIWDLAATDVFPAATGPGQPAQTQELPPAPEEDSGTDGS
jgi:hypothetical protein